MNKVYKIFDSHKDAENAKNEYYNSLDPNKRVELLLDIISSYLLTPKLLEL